MRYAIVQGSAIINIVDWDGTSSWSPPEGTQAIVAPDACDTTWTYLNGTFTPPPPPPPGPASAGEVFANYRALIGRRASVLERSSDPDDQMAALKLRVTLATGG